MQPRVNALLLVILLLFCSVAAEAAPYTGVVSVDSIEIQPGTSFSIAVRLTNNSVALSALTVPLQYSGSSLTLDSASFVGSMLPANFTGLFGHNATARTMQISYIPNFENPIPTMTASTGVLARLFFKISPLAGPGTILVDSVNKDSIVAGTIHVYTRVEVADNTGLAAGVYTPEFIPGGIKVLVPTDVNDEEPNLPITFSLGQNYPNPFNPATTIEFSLPSASHVKLEVFNVLGQLVTTAIDRRMGAGTHQVEFNASALPSGIYFYRLESAHGTETRKMILLK